MNITAALVAPFTWVRDLFLPKLSPEVENAVEQLRWNPLSFNLAVQKDEQDMAVIFIRSIEPLWSRLHEAPMNVYICITPSDCWLINRDGSRRFTSKREKTVLIAAINTWGRESD